MRITHLTSQLAECALARQDAAVLCASLYWYFDSTSESHSVWCSAMQDVIARRGKLWILYKRAGHRVIINARGDLIVRPSFAEANVQRVPGGGWLLNHAKTWSPADALAGIASGCRLQTSAGEKGCLLGFKESSSCCTRLFNIL